MLSGRRLSWSLSGMVARVFGPLAARSALRRAQRLSFAIWVLLDSSLAGYGPASGTLQSVLTARLWWDEWAEAHSYDEASRFRRGLLLLSRGSESVYMSFLTMINGAPDFDENHRLATRLLNMPTVVTGVAP